MYGECASPGRKFQGFFLSTKNFFYTFLHNGVFISENMKKGERKNE
jgi:hypothetical protein